MACVSCLALDSAALLGLGVGRRGGFSSLSFPAMTGTVGISPNWSFRSCSTFVEFFHDLYSFKHVAGGLVALHFKIPVL